MRHYVDDEENGWILGYMVLVAFNLGYVLIAFLLTLNEPHAAGERNYDFIFALILVMICP